MVRALAFLLPRAALLVLVALLGPLVVLVALPFRSLPHDRALKKESRPTERLPRWAAWWDDPNNGCWGDTYWRTDHHPDTYKTFLWMWWWLVVRNPATGFAILKLGVHGQVVTALRRHGPLLIATVAGRDIPMLQTRCPRLRIGPDHTNVTTLGEPYWYPFELIVQPWVCRR